MRSSEDWLPLRAVLRRELLVQLRRKSAAYSFMLLVLLGITLFWFMTQGATTRRFGDGILISGLVLLYGASLIRVTSMAALSLVSERQAHTLEQLQLSHLLPGEVVFAKAISAAGYFLLVCIGMLPIFGVVFFYVGVEVLLFLSGFLFLLTSSLAHAGVGLMVGVTQSSPTSASISAIVLTAVMSGGAAYVTAFVGAFISIFMRTFSGGNSANLSTPSYFLAFSVVNLFIFRVGLHGAAKQLYKPLPLRAAYPVPPRPAPTPPPSAAKPSGEGYRPAPENFHWIPDGKNPIIVKEYRGDYYDPTLPRPKVFTLIVIVFIVFLAYAMLVAIASGRSSPSFAWVYFVVGLICSLSIPFSAAGLARERIAPTYEMLTMSALTPREIIVGHLWANVPHVILFNAVLVVVTPFAAFFGKGGFWAAGGYYLLLHVAVLAQLLVLCAITALAGVLGNTVSRALGLAFLFSVGYAGMGKFVGFIVVAWMQIFRTSPTYLSSGRGGNFAYLQIFDPALFWSMGGTRLPLGIFTLNILYHLLLAAALGWLAVQVLTRTQTADSRMQRFLNRSLAPKDF